MKKTKTWIWIFVSLAFGLILAGWRSSSIERVSAVPLECSTQGDHLVCFDSQVLGVQRCEALDDEVVLCSLPE